MIEAVIFDMDGVLVDSEPFHKSAEREMFSELGFSLTEEEHNSFAGMSAKNIWQSLKSRFSLNQSPEELSEIKSKKYLAIIDRKIKGMPGAVKLIEELNGKLKLAIASSSRMNHISMISEEIGIKRYMNIIVSGESLEKSKPEPDIFLKAAREIGADPAKCIVIEDAVKGIIAAKRAGMICIGITTSFPKERLSQADLVIDSLEELDYDKLMRLGSVKSGE